MTKAIASTLDIVYDYQVFAAQGYGGASRYIWEIAKHIADYPETRVQVLAFAHFNEYLRESHSEIIRGRYIPIIPKTKIIRDKVNQELTRAWFRNHKAQIVHETYYAPASWSTHPYRSVVTVHDMVHEKFPEYFRKDDPTIRNKEAAVRRADHIICISESTKRDLLERIDLNPEKVSVVHHGFTHFAETVKMPAKKPPPYILTVGPRVGYKNFHGLLKAYARSKAKRDFELLCFGSSPFSPKELQAMHSLGLSHGQVKHMSGSDAVLRQLYKDAALFVYPSLYEGFGIPPLEAMSLGCAVACSNTSSLPEVVGDAAELFEPDKVESIQTALERVLYSTGRTEDLVKRGTERAAHFSWDRCATETYRVYQSLL